MAVTEKHIEQTVVELRKIYQQTGEHLKTQVLSADLSDFQKARANELIKQIDAQVAALNATAYKFSKAGIPKAYRRGMDISAEQLSVLGIKNAASMGNVIHTSSVQVIADQMALDLIQANGTIATGLQQYIRKTQQNVVQERLLNRKIGQGLIAGETRRDTSDRILQDLKKNLAEGALVKAGSKNFKPEEYAELVARTRTREAVTQGAINTGVENDIELFQVSVHEGPCPVCQQYQGRVYSITGSSSDFPKLARRPPFHPRCKHVLVPVTEGFLKRRGLYEALSDLSNDPEAQMASNEAYKAFVTAHKPKPEPGRKLPKPERPPIDPPYNPPAPLPKAPEPPVPDIDLTAPFPTAIPIPNPVPDAVRTVDMIPRGIGGADDFGARLKPVPNVKLGGSTGARMFVDDEGTKWVVKTYSGRAEQAKNEYLANRIYELNKVSVPEGRLAKVDGDLGIALRFIDAPGAKVVGRAGADAAAKLESIRKGFAVDAFVANWDVAGLDFDNIMWVPGKASQAWRIDQGGSLLFRAQGGPKGAAFGSQVNELVSLRDPSINANTARLFAGIDDKKLEAYYRWLLHYTKPATIDQLVAEAGFSGPQADQLRNTLTARLDHIKKLRAQLRAKLKAAELAVSPNIQSGGVSIPGQRRTLRRSNVFNDTLKMRDAVPKSEQLPSDELRELRAFTGSSFTSYNNAARQGKGHKHLDRLLASDSLPGLDGFTRRQVSNVPGRDAKLQKFASGQWAFEEWPAYSSSTIKPGGTYGANYGGWNHIILNRGMQGSYVAPLSSHTHELELLYGRNSRFRVIGWDYGYGYDGNQTTGHFLFLEEVQGDIPESQAPPVHVDSKKFMQEWQRRWDSNLPADDLDPRNFAR